MVLAKTYPILIKEALNAYVSLVNQSPSPHYDVVRASSDQHQQYVVRKLGWKEGRRIRQTVRRAGMPVLHVALRDRKIWTSEDWTEDGIATYFQGDGVPSEDMVLGWKPNMMRPYTEFAVA